MIYIYMYILSPTPLVYCSCNSFKGVQPRRPSGDPTSPFPLPLPVSRSMTPGRDDWGLGFRGFRVWGLEAQSIRWQVLLHSSSTELSCPVRPTTNTPTFEDANPITASTNSGRRRHYRNWCWSLLIVGRE